jgi:hypothetical protein
MSRLPALPRGAVRRPPVLARLFGRRARLTERDVNGNGQTTEYIEWRGCTYVTRITVYRGTVRKPPQATVRQGGGDHWAGELYGREA